MKLFSETEESQYKVQQLVSTLFNTNVHRITTKYVIDKNTNQKYQSMIIHFNMNEYSSTLLDIHHNKIYDGIRFHIINRNLIPPLYIPSIHVLVNIYELFITLFGHDYIYKVIKYEKKMDEDGNVPVVIFFNQTLPRTDSLKNFYLEMYRSRYGYRYKLDRNHGGTEIIHFLPKK